VAAAADADPVTRLVLGWLTAKRSENTRAAYARDIGIAMRRSFAVLYLDAGGSLRDLQNALGLTDPRATGRYDRGPALGDRAPADSAPSDSAPADRAPGDLVAAYLADPAS
jgi:hypothetical protein